MSNRIQGHRIGTKGLSRLAWIAITALTLAWGLVWGTPLTADGKPSYAEQDPPPLSGAPSPKTDFAQIQGNALQDYEDILLRSMGRAEGPSQAEQPKTFDDRPGIFLMAKCSQEEDPPPPAESPPEEPSSSETPPCSKSPPPEESQPATPDKEPEPKKKSEQDQICPQCPEKKEKDWRAIQRESLQRRLDAEKRIKERLKRTDVEETEEREYLRRWDDQDLQNQIKNLGGLVPRGGEGLEGGPEIPEELIECLRSHSPKAQDSQRIREKRTRDPDSVSVKDLNSQSRSNARTGRPLKDRTERSSAALKDAESRDPGPTVVGTRTKEKEPETRSIKRTVDPLAGSNARTGRPLKNRTERSSPSTKDEITRNLVRTPSGSYVRKGDPNGPSYDPQTGKWSPPSDGRSIKRGYTFDPKTGEYLRAQDREPLSLSPDRGLPGAPTGRLQVGPLSGISEKQLQSCIRRLRQTAEGRKKIPEDLFDQIVNSQGRMRRIQVQSGTPGRTSSSQPIKRGQFGPQGNETMEQWKDRLAQNVWQSTYDKVLLQRAQARAARQRSGVGPSLTNQSQMNQKWIEEEDKKWARYEADNAAKNARTEQYQKWLQTASEEELMRYNLNRDGTARAAYGVAKRGSGMGPTLDYSKVDAAEAAQRAQREAERNSWKARAAKQREEYTQRTGKEHVLDRMDREAQERAERKEQERAERIARAEAKERAKEEAARERREKDFTDEQKARAAAARERLEELEDIDRPLNQDERLERERLEYEAKTGKESYKTRKEREARERAERKEQERAERIARAEAKELAKGEAALERREKDFTEEQKARAAAARERLEELEDIDRPLNQDERLERERLEYEAKTGKESYKTRVAREKREMAEREQARKDQIETARQERRDHEEELERKAAERRAAREEQTRMTAAKRKQRAEEREKTGEGRKKGGPSEATWVDEEGNKRRIETDGKGNRKDSTLRKDGTLEVKETRADGTEVLTTTDKDNKTTKTTTTIREDGTKVETRELPDRKTIVTTTSTDPETGYQVTETVETSTTYVPPDKYTTRITYYDDEKGERVTKDVRWEGGDKTRVHRERVVMDRDGNIVSREVGRDRGDVYRVDRDGNIVKQENDGALETQYGANGLVTEVRRDENGNITSKTTYPSERSTDEDGNTHLTVLRDGREETYRVQEDGSLTQEKWRWQQDLGKADYLRSKIELGLSAGWDDLSEQEQAEWNGMAESRIEAKAERERKAREQQELAALREQDRRDTEAQYRRWEEEDRERRKQWDEELQQQRMRRAQEEAAQNAAEEEAYWRSVRESKARKRAEAQQTAIQEKWDQANPTNKREVRQFQLDRIREKAAEQKAIHSRTVETGEIQIIDEKGDIVWVQGTQEDVDTARKKLGLIDNLNNVMDVDGNQIAKLNLAEAYVRLIGKRSYEGDPREIMLSGRDGNRTFNMSDYARARQLSDDPVVRAYEQNALRNVSLETREEVMEGVVKGSEHIARGLNDLFCDLNPADPLVQALTGVETSGKNVGKELSTLERVGKVGEFGLDVVADKLISRKLSSLQDPDVGYKAKGPRLQTEADLEMPAMAGRVKGANPMRVSKGMDAVPSRGMAASGSRGMSASGPRGMDAASPRTSTATGSKGMDAVSPRGMDAAGPRGMDAAETGGMPAASQRSATATGSKGMDAVSPRGMDAAGPRGMDAVPKDTKITTAPRSMADGLALRKDRGTQSSASTPRKTPKTGSSDEPTDIAKTMDTLDREFGVTPRPPLSPRRGGEPLQGSVKGHGPRPEADRDIMAPIRQEPLQSTSPGRVQMASAGESPMRHAGAGSASAPSSRVPAQSARTGSKDSRATAAQSSSFPKNKKPSEMSPPERQAYNDAKMSEQQGAPTVDPGDSVVMPPRTTSYEPDLPPGSYSHHLTRKEIDDLFQPGANLTGEQIIQKADLIRAGRAPKWATADTETLAALDASMRQAYPDMDLYPGGRPPSGGGMAGTSGTRIDQPLKGSTPGGNTILEPGRGGGGSPPPPGGNRSFKASPEDASGKGNTHILDRRSFPSEDMLPAQKGNTHILDRSQLPPGDSGGARRASGGGGAGVPPEKPPGRNSASAAGEAPKDPKKGFSIEFPGSRQTPGGKPPSIEFPPRTASGSPSARPTIEGAKSIAKTTDHVITTVNRPADFLRHTYGKDSQAAKAYEIAVEHFGNDVKGVAGSYAKGTARTHEWPKNVSYEEAAAIDKMPNLSDRTISKLPAESQRVYQTGKELHASEEGFPSDMDIPVSVSDPQRLNEAARDIYNRTGVLVEFTPPKIRPDIDIPKKTSSLPVKTAVAPASQRPDVGIPTKARGNVEPIRGPPSSTLSTPRASEPLPLRSANEYKDLVDRQSAGQDVDLSGLARPGIAKSMGDELIVLQGAGRYEKTRPGEYLDLFVPSKTKIPEKLGAEVLQENIPGDLVKNANLLSSRGVQGANPVVVNNAVKGEGTWKRVRIPARHVDAPTSEVVAKIERELGRLRSLSVDTDSLLRRTEDMSPIEKLDFLRGQGN